MFLRRLLVFAVLLPSALAAQTPNSATPRTFESIKQRAEAARDAGQLTEALQLYREGIRLKSNWLEGWWSLGSIYYDQDRFAECQSALSHLVAVVADPGPALVLLGLCEYETGDYAKASAHLQRWEKEGEQGGEQLKPAVDFHRALLLTRESQFDKSQQLLDAAAKSMSASAGTSRDTLVEALGLASLRMPFLPGEYPRDQRERVWLAGEAAFFSARGEVAQAKEFKDRLASIYPREITNWKPPSAPASKSTTRPETLSFEQLSKLAEQARAAQRADEAIAYYQRALKLRPEWKEGLWNSATLLFEKERWPEVRDAMRVFVTLEPKAGPAWAMLGLAEYQTRDYARSLDHLREASTLGIGDRKPLADAIHYHQLILLTRFEHYAEATDALLNLARAEQSESRLEEACGLAALNLPLLPEEISEARRDLIQRAGAGTFAMMNQRLDEAAQIFDRLVAANPKEPQLHLLRGLLLLNTRPEEGIAELRRVSDSSPSNVPARLELAERLKDTQPNEALRFAEQALAQNPASATALMIKGQILVANGDTAAGLRELEAARDLAPSNLKIHWALLQAYTSAGRTADATREKAEIQRLKQQEAQP